MDGDGDFDPEDVQAYLADKGFLSKNFKKSKSARDRKRSSRSRASSDASRASSEASRPSEQTTTPTEPTEEKKEGESAAAGVGEGESAAGGAGNFLDRDGDGEVGWNDVFESKVEGPSVEDEMMVNLVEKQKIPWFVIIESLAVFALWCAWAIKRSQDNGNDPLQELAGLDSFKDGFFDLRLAGPECEDYRLEAWRWLTYQFTHVGAMHVMMNVFLTLLLGIPLEGLHGHVRMAVMWNVGVFGGACCYFLIDSHTVVVGCSGGCYALLGLHLADLIINFKQKKFRLPTIILLLLLIGVDVFSYMMSMSSETTSHSAHIGGAIAGLIIGCAIGKNLKVKIWEKVVIGILILAGVGLIGYSLAWLFMQEGGPINVFEASAGQNGWCWVRQVYNPEITEVTWECVRCGTKDCIDEWNLQKHIEKVSPAACAIKGLHYDGR